VLVEPGELVALAGGIERALADRGRLARAGLEPAQLYRSDETAPANARRQPGCCERRRHRCRARPASRPQALPCGVGAAVDELVVVANLPLDIELSPSAPLLENDRPAGFRANVNRGVAETKGEFVVIANPDTEPAPDAVAILVDFASGDARRGSLSRSSAILTAAGSLAPPLSDGEPQYRAANAAALPGAALRTPAPPLHANERPDHPVQANWMLAAFVLLRREMLDELGGFDERFRLYGEDIELCYRAAKAGWEQWYVPAAVVTHRYAAVIDRKLLTRRTLWHWRGIARFVWKHPERLKAL
jgi:hypothetical protein